MRKSIEVFREEFRSYIPDFDGTIGGLKMWGGQKAPETYGELVVLVANRLDQSSGSDDPLDTLINWLIEDRKIKLPNYPYHKETIEKVSAVVLMGELQNPDEYVASLPFDEGAIALPSLSLVRALL